MTFEAPPLRDWRAMAARVTTFGPVTDVRLVETLSPCVAGIMAHERVGMALTASGKECRRVGQGGKFDHLDASPRNLIIIIYI